MARALFGVRRETSLIASKKTQVTQDAVTPTTEPPGERLPKTNMIMLGTPTGGFGALIDGEGEHEPLHIVGCQVDRRAKREPIGNFLPGLQCPTTETYQTYMEMCCVALVPENTSIQWIVSRPLVHEGRTFAVVDVEVQRHVARRDYQLVIKANST